MAAKELKERRITVSKGQVMKRVEGISTLRPRILWHKLLMYAAAQYHLIRTVER